MGNILKTKTFSSIGLVCSERNT